jgi:tetratricopeptide (TPR) repeat protein
VSLLAGIVGCARQPEVAGETVVFDERVTLVRGETLDTFEHEVAAPFDGTCVAVVEEDDADLVLALKSAANGSAPSSVEVESGLNGEGVELAALRVVRASTLAIQLRMPPDMPAPARSQVRITCYDENARTAEASARVEAYQAWSQAMLRSETTSEEAIKRRRELLDLAVARLESAGKDPGMAAWARLVKGNLLHGTMVDLRGALDELRAAERAFAGLAVVAPRNVARARLQVGSTLTELLNDATWTNPTPAEAQAESGRIFTELSAENSPLSPLEKARAVNFLGAICFQLGDYTCATRHFVAAVDAVHKIGHRREELIILHNLGVTELDLGNYASSVKYFDRVIPLVSKEFSPDYSSHHYNAGVAYASFGDTSRGIKHLLLALQDAREKESAIDLGRVMNGLGVVYWRRGDAQQAETFFAESLKQRRIASDGSGLILSLSMMGRFARFQGRHDEALAMHREALTRASTPNMKARANYELALDEAAARRYGRAIAFCRDALSDSGNVVPIRRANIQIVLAEYLIAYRPDEAAFAEADELSRSALDIALEKADLVLEASARRVRAKLLAVRGHRVEARREYQSAIAVILDFRGSAASPELQAATLAYEQETFREYVDLLMRGAVARGTGRFEVAGADEEDALRVLELARSGNLSGIRDARLDAATQARIDALLQQMASKRVRLAALNGSANPGGKMTELLQLEMSNLRAEVDRLRGGAAGDSRSGKLPASIARPWPAARAGVTQLSYALGARNTYLWARDARGLRVAVLAVSPARLENAFAEFAQLDHVRSPGRFEPALTGLARSLLPPGALDPESSSLEIVADGSLGALPFAALRSPDSGKRVIETHAVRSITSMFDVAAPAPGNPRRMAFVGIASGTGKMRSAGREFASLGAARAEARAIADLFAGQKGDAQIKLLTASDGDAETIRTLWSGGADAVHFATHGLANLRYPSASLLLLPKGGGDQPAYLTAGQVQEWRGDAGLVFLAACETAAGPTRFAEGMTGLPRSFLGAGARGIVGTLWPVEDVYESQFSVEFYRRFIVGRDAEAALAETQRDWLKPRAGEKPGDYQQRLATAWAHVFYARPRGS